jgi:hypothetical protein
LSRLRTKGVEATVFLADGVRETLARPIIAVGILLELDHPQLAPVYAFVYLTRFRNYRSCR